MSFSETHEGPLSGSEVPSRKQEYSEHFQNHSHPDSSNDASFNAKQHSQQHHCQHPNPQQHLQHECYSGPPTENVITTQPEMNLGSVTITKEKPRDCLIPAIFACIFFCCPIGVFAIIEAVDSRQAYSNGDMERANTKGNRAQKLVISAIIVGVMWIVVLMAYEIHMLTHKDE